MYDVSSFATRHPGGREVLEKYNGQDVEKIMQDSGVHLHSKAAYTILEKYLIGPVNSTQMLVRETI